MALKFVNSTYVLQESLEKVIEKHKPNCLVADMFLPFATDVAAKFNIPRLVFHGTSYFSQCLMHAIFKYEPHKQVLSDEEEFVIPHFPHEIKFITSQLHPSMRGLGDKQINDEMMKILSLAKDAEERSFGFIINSFYELEPDYAEYYTKVMGRRAWHIGPVSLCNHGKEAKFQRGKDSSISEHECLEWLNTKKARSVVYISHGSLVEASTLQLEEIAMGLEASKQDFIWVVRTNNKVNGDEEVKNEWLLHEFEKRMEGKGLIIRGWAPQMLILDHEAIGAFVTHCGWNSTLEGMSCGVPMVTWPVFAEQFCNEKYITSILNTGVGVGAKQHNRVMEGNVKREDIKEAIRKVMVGEEALEMRIRAKKLKDLATVAFEVGGSSYCNMQSLMHELSSYNT
uniref:Glycosyltransferase n=1 Tax=Chenopodium quinoa TaxID=63459 RepID=A0A803KVF3_CHEQI